MATRPKKTKTITITMTLRQAELIAFAADNLLHDDDIWIDTHGPGSYDEAYEAAEVLNRAIQEAKAKSPNAAHEAPSEERE